MAEQRALLVFARAAEEVRGVLREIVREGDSARDLIEMLLVGIGVVDEAIYVDRLPEAEHVLREAVASRNGAVSDAHLLALAWMFDADLWSHDRDFAGTGRPSWSNANPRRAVEPGSA